MPLPWLSSWESFVLGLESDGKSAETLRVYRTSVASFGQHLIAEKGNFPHLDAVSREEVRRYLAALAKAGKEHRDPARAMTWLRHPAPAYAAKCVASIIGADVCSERRPPEARAVSSDPPPSR